MSDNQDLAKLLIKTKEGGQSVSLTALSNAYDEYILELESIPEGAWNVLLGIFSDSTFLGRRGLERFLLEMNVDLPKYSPQQLREFLDVLVTAVSFMSHEIARHAAGDFIARAYSEDVAIRTFKKLASGLPKEKHAAMVGLDVLLRQSDLKQSSAASELLEVLVVSYPEWHAKV